MKTPRNAARLVAELREVIGKSQTQFAAMIGVSKHTIISVENRRNALSRTLAKRIQIATGADLFRGQLQSPYRNAPYTREDFDNWRKSYGSDNPEVVLDQFNEMKTWLKVILLAAAKPGLAGNRDRLPNLYVSLADWLDTARKKFKLEKEIEDVLEDETRDIDRPAYSIPALFDNPNFCKEVENSDGIDLSVIKQRLKKPQSDDWLIIEDEFRLKWTPGGIPLKQPCKIRKNIPIRKFGVVTFKPGTTMFQCLQFIRQAKLQNSFPAALKNRQTCPEL
jgi:DNA-binding XRE family transcriptional regulator